MNSFFKEEITKSKYFGFAIDDLVQYVIHDRGMEESSLKKTILKNANYFAFIIDEEDLFSDINLLCTELIKNNEMIIIGLNLLKDTEKSKNICNHLINLFEKYDFKELPNVYVDRIVFVKNTILRK